MKRPAGSHVRTGMATNTTSEAERALEPDGTAERILREAKALFAERGYERAYIKDISRRAQVNIAAVNYHFESKELLYHRVLEAFGEGELARATETLGKPKSREELRLRLQSFLHATIDHVQGEPQVFRIVLRELDDGGPSSLVYGGAFGQIFDTLAAFFARARRQGLLRSSVDPRFAASLLLNQLLATLRSEVSAAPFAGTFRDETSRRRWVQATLDVVLDGALEAT